jgi:hypothetical protein
MFCIMWRLEKERDINGNHVLHCWKQNLAKNDQPTPPRAMLEVGRLSFVDASYRIPKWKKCQSLAKTFHYTKMCPSSLWISLNFEWIWTFLPCEIGEPLIEWGLVARDNELVLVKQGYSQVKYKFTKPFTC